MENKMTPKEALEKIKKHRYLHTVATMAGYVKEETNVGRELKQECKIIDQALTEHEKQKQILEVLKNKVIAKDRIKNCENVNAYNHYIILPFSQLTETEFNLIKEWLK